MKVIYVSYDGMTDALGRSQVIPYVAGLSEKGYKMHVVSCEKKQIAKEEVQEVSELFSKHNISWTALPFSTRPPWFSKIIDIVRIKKTVDRLHRKHNFDLVHCRSYIAALAGLYLKQKYGVKLVFDMRGFWANERIEGNIWSLYNPFYNLIYRYFKKKEKDFFEHSDAVVSLTRNGRQVIKELFGKDAFEKTGVIPCCVDTELFSKDNISDERIAMVKKQLGITEQDFVLSYLGSIGTWYMTDEMLRFFKLLQSHYNPSKFLFISGDDPQEIYKKGRKLGIDTDKIVVARATRSQVPLYLSSSDISVFFIKPVFSKRASSPTKQAEILSMGIPLICNTGIGDTDLLFADEKVGVVLRSFSDEEFVRAISKIKEVLKADPAVIRGRAIKHFNLEDGIEKYHQLYKSVLST